MKHIPGLFASLLLVMAAPPAFAHGLLMKVEGKGTDIAGRLYYSNGLHAGGEWIELIDEAAPDKALSTIQTDKDGRFHLKGETGHQYKVRATGEEGHEIVMAITLDAPDTEGKMVQAEAEQSNDQEIPAWALIGGLLLLSIIPAFWFRRRGTS